MNGKISREVNILRWTNTLTKVKRLFNTANEVRPNLNLSIEIMDQLTTLACVNTLLTMLIP